METSPNVWETVNPNVHGMSFWESNKATMADQGHTEQDQANPNQEARRLLVN
jgi:hypothetical protein